MMLGQQPRGWALASSVAIHIIAVFLILGLSQYTIWQVDETFDWTQYKVEPLRLHLSEPLYFRAIAAGKAPTTEVSTAARHSGDAAAAPKLATPSRRSLVPNLELPVVHEIAKNRPIVIQPEVRPHITPPATLPPLAFWARQSRDVPKPNAAKEILIPGGTEALAEPLKLAAPPMSTVPNHEKVVANVNVSLPPALAVPALPASNSATLPLRVRNSLEPVGTPFDRSSGQAANVIAVAANPSHIDDVEIAKGLNNVPPSEGENGGSNGFVGAGVSTEAASSDSGRAAAGSRGGQIANSNATGHDAALGASAGNDATVSQDGGGERPRTMRNVSGNIGVRPVAPLAVTRIEHPLNGSFDVVIMQSGTRDDLPDLGGLLTGNPVYTVYLTVGDQKDWLLEYCVPARESVRPNSSEINVDDASAVTPPYPISTAVPNSILSQHLDKHIVLHGVLNLKGTLTEVKAPETTGGLMTELLATLSEWQFRPALRNKKPIEVEILLVIPPRG
jgi:hypothetical protein